MSNPHVQHTPTLGTRPRPSYSLTILSFIGWVTLLAVLSPRQPEPTLLQELDTPVQELADACHAQGKRLVFERIRNRLVDTCV